MDAGGEDADGGGCQRLVWGPGASRADGAERIPEVGAVSADVNSAASGVIAKHHAASEGGQTGQ